MSGPDLVVTEFSASDSNPAPDTPFTLAVAVRNDGDGAAAATTLRYYQSTDATITTADTVVGTAAVAGLAAAGSSSASVELSAPSTPGTYYYGACVDAVTGESDTTNNCSASVTVMVAGVDSPPPPQSQPDLVVASLSVSESNPAPDTPFTLAVAVRNDGDGAAAATTLRYYQSTDATITTADTVVGTAAVAGLGRGGKQQRVGGAQCAVNPRDVLLRRVRGRGGGGIGHDQQLLRVGHGHGRRADGPGGDRVLGERHQPDCGFDVDPLGDGTE